MKQIKFYGRGGQGVVTASKIFVSAVIQEGKFAHAVPSFGQERKGAAVFAYARLDEKPIDLRSFVYNPDGVIVFDLFIRELGIDISSGVKPETVLVANTKMSPEETGLTSDFKKIGCIDAFAITEEILGKAPPNAAMLGALCKTTEWVSLESICNALREYLPGKRGELNAKAARCGFSRVQIWKK